MNRRRLAMLSIFMICLLGISLGLTAPIPSARAEGEVILFVKESASSEDTAGDGETGYSWENAFSNLQDALDEAEDLQKEDETLQVEIRVAAGTYYPDGIGRYRGFRLRNNVAILGGFPAEGGALEERDWQRHETILSGNIGDPDKSTDNSYHVILAEDVDETAVLDGVIVSGGHTSPGFTPKYPPSFNLWTSGGGIYCDSSSPIIRNVQIRDNFAWYGGGMYIYQGSPQLDNVTFTGNTAFTGGAMRNESCNLTATGVKFEYNAALSGSGGAMANYSSSVSVADAEFLSNTADSAFGGNGGAVYNFGGSVFNCTGASFQSNHAFYSGGAIYSQGGGISLRNISFVGNQAGYAADDPEGVELSSFHPTNGGAVFFAPADAAAYSQGEEEYYPGIIQDAFFIGNKAGQGGGAVYAAEVKIVNSVFSGNSAVYGGGLYLEKRGRVVNSTFVANDALGCGGGAFIDFFDEGPVQENPALANTILWGNTAPEMGMQVFADNAIPGISHCLIQDAFPEGEWDDSLGIDLGGNIAADPRFVSTPDPSGMGGDLRLRSNSPARDSGDNQWISGVSKDILGQARIVRNRVDMGAYEYQTPPSPPPPPPVSTEPTLERLGGKDRIETAVEISKAGWTSSDKVFLARSDDFADSLAGVPLAYKENAPILLTKPQLLPQATRAEIQRLGADTVVILGGKEAVSPAVEQELKKMGLVVQRVSGANRFATAAAIAALVAPEGCAEIALVNGRTFADALSVAAYAADKGMPILLTEVRVIPGETKAAISGLEADSVLVVGGISVVSAGSLKDLDNYLRVAGPDRYATAIALAEHFNPPSERIFVATGLDFPDCLTGAVLAAKEGCGLILINGDIPAVVKNYLAGKDVQTFTVLGGVLAVSPETAQKLIN